MPRAPRVGIAPLGRAGDSARMLTPHSWITEFVGRVLRQGHAVDPHWIFDTAVDLYPEQRGADPEVVADSTFGPEQPSSPTRAGIG